jgi:hypothetical protein
VSPFRPPPLFLPIANANLFFFLLRPRKKKATAAVCAALVLSITSLPLFFWPRDAEKWRKIRTRCLGLPISKLAHIDGAYQCLTHAELRQKLACALVGSYEDLHRIDIEALACVGAVLPSEALWLQEMKHKAITISDRYGADLEKAKRSKHSAIAGGDISCAFRSF